MRKLELGTLVCVVALFCMATTVTSPAQTYTTLVSFDGTNGEAPWFGPLVQGADGNFYGTTLLGGTGSGTNICTSCGTVFKVTPAGELTTLHNFCSETDCSDGARPTLGLTFGSNGNFYGTTSEGGSFSGGTMFEVTPAGVFTTVYQFCSQANCADAGAATNLVLASNGNFYGAGVNVFEITPAGKYKTLYAFCSQPNCADGEGPGGALALGPNGTIYGTTGAGGAGGQGTIFAVSPNGKEQTLHSFAAAPDAVGNVVNGVILGTDGYLYGSLYAGGTRAFGSIFKVTTSGHYTTLVNFCANPGCDNSDEPEGALVQGTDGNFYGTTYMGGPAFYGNIFQVTPSGAFTQVYTFCNGAGCPDGENPVSGLVQGTDGNFYGATTGGSNQKACIGGCGTLYSLSMGLSPFVEANPGTGKVGRRIDIFGDNLTGTSSVTFNGTPATFVVASSADIKAVVPDGATSGTIQVVTPGGTLNSNVAFRVVP
jgi:uncharacterized repeat protein (TIGR03803 family)